MGLGARGRGPQAPSPISAPNQLFELLRCSGRLIELPPRHPAFRRAGVPFGLLAVSAPSRLTACWRSVRLIGCAKRSNSSRFATYGKLKRRTPVASRPTASSNARPPGSLRSPSDAAPNQLFELLRCSGRLIELKLKRSTFRFAPLTLRCRTESAFQAAPVFRMAYLPYLTAFRMQAKQIQRLPLRGAGAKRLKGGPLGLGARGRARRPLPQSALGLRPHLTAAQNKTG